MIRGITLEQRVSALIIDTEELGKADHTDSWIFSKSVAYGKLFIVHSGFLNSGSRYKLH